MTKPAKKRTQLRAVRQLHIPLSLDRKIVKAAKLADQSIAEFIREGAGKLADETIANAA